MVDFYGFHVGKYASPMDPMGLFEANFVNGFWILPMGFITIVELPKKQM